MKLRWCMGMFICLAWLGSACADPPGPRPLLHWWNWQTCPSVGCCPDDYVHKPLPCIYPLPRCGGPDDYCRKPMPCVPPVSRCGLPDDYCRKPLPCLLCPPVSPYLQCGTPDDHGTTCGHRR